MCSTTFATLIAVAALQLRSAEKNFNPGAGLGVTGPGDTVHKDGFYAVECLTDNMYETADMYGENRELYSNKFNVSIVRYADVVDREKARPITPQVCFDFCRTISDMHFFGLLNGRDCYCTPYYERKTSGGGVCNLPCEGDSAVMCGGKEMMNVYEMHTCGNTGEDLEAALNEAKRVVGAAKAAGAYGVKAAGLFEAAANSLKLESNNVGDMNSHDLAQQMKAHTATVLHPAEEASAAATALNEAITVADALKGGDFSVPDNVYKVEEAIRQLEELGEQATVLGEESKRVNDALFPAIATEAALAGSELFVPVLEAVDRWLDTEADEVGAATTCTGEVATTPMFGLTMSECAEACNTHAPSSSDDYCVGFQHFYMGDLDLSPSSTSYTADGECVDRYPGWHEYEQSYCDDDGHCGVKGGHPRFTCAAYQEYIDNAGDGIFGWPVNAGPCDGWPYTGQGGLKGNEACCACNAGQLPVLTKPHTGICFLFKEVEHVYKYACDEAEDECVDEDGSVDVAIGDGETAPFECAILNDFPEYCTMEVPSAIVKNCCQCKEVLKTLAQANSTKTSEKVIRKDSKKKRKARKLDDARHADAGLRAAARRVLKAPKTALLKKERGPVSKAVALTTANHCMMRFSSIHAAPFKPEFEELNTCLDVGQLVATGTSGTDF